MILFSAVLVQALCVLPLVSSWYNLDFLYEQKNNLKYPSARRHMNKIEHTRRKGPSGNVANLGYSWKEHPAPLPVPKLTLMQKRIRAVKMHAPYETLYQGVRRKTDKRVYNRRFNHTAEEMPQQVLSEGLFDCVLSHIAIESHGGMPVILRGGAGYRYFMVYVKAKAGDDLQGRIRAYCPSAPEEPKMGKMKQL